MQFNDLWKFKISIFWKKSQLPCPKFYTIACPEPKVGAENFYFMPFFRRRRLAVNYSACLDRHVPCVTPWLFFFPEFLEDPTASRLLIFFKNGLASHNVYDEVVTTQVLHP